MKKVKVFVGCCLMLLAVAACKEKADESTAAAGNAYNEKHRPQFHFSPAANWMNDPNGMFYLAGEYHLFYQYYPDSTVWGPMHWGHAVSKDMVHWEHLPIALYPDSLGYIFSGSAVVDVNNTSGLGTAENPPIVAMFTYHEPAGEKAGRDDYQTQGLAYSVDKGRTWVKYAGNPVIKNPGIKDFRDPKVDWNEEFKKWIMVLAVKDHVEFYASDNLKVWTKLSEFGHADGDHGGVWECPDLFALTDSAGHKKYVLLLSINPGGPNGGSATQYFTGAFDGKNFISDTPGKNRGYLDYGPDNYAGVTFSNIDDNPGARYLIGWMSNWLYAQVVPTSPWRSATTVARKVSLDFSNALPVLTSTPVEALNSIVLDTRKVDDVRGTEARVISGAVDFPITFSAFSGNVSAGNFAITLSNDKGQQVLIGYDADTKRFYIDRTKGGDHKFFKDFGTISYAPRISTAATISFTVVIDASSVEVFFDDGKTVMTSLFFPDDEFDKLALKGEADNFLGRDLVVKQLSSIW